MPDTSTSAEDHDLLIRMDEKMDTLLRWQEDHKEVHTDITRRLQAGEEWRHRELGVLALLVIAMQVSGDWIMQHFFGRK